MITCSECGMQKIASRLCAYCKLFDKKVRGM